MMTDHDIITYETVTSNYTQSLSDYLKFRTGTNSACKIQRIGGLLRECATGSSYKFTCDIF